jgi:hydroxymethylpyrimidine/phosphomethylpyrimidine kinase
MIELNISILVYFLCRKNFLTSSSGLEADQRVLAAHGVYALTATTGLTAQNTLGVQDIFVVPSEFVRKQINAGLEDVGADVVKLGKSNRSIFKENNIDDLVRHAFICRDD